MFTRLQRWLAPRKPQTIRSRTASAASRLLVETLEDRLVPAVLTVNTLADGNTASADDFLSLREAIKIVNSGSLAGAGHALTVAELAQIDQTTALGTNDTIRFAPGLNGGTITLTADGGGRLDLLRPMKIVGPDRGVTISGNNQFGIFHVGDLGAGGEKVSLANLTLTQGKSTQGGAILNEGTLDVTACRFTRNQAGDGGAIANGGSLMIRSSTFDNNATVSMSGSQGRGGAIVNDKRLEVYSSTFVDNTASGDGGAVFTYKQNTSTSLFNSIVAHNFKGTSPNDLGTIASKGVSGDHNFIGDAATAGGLLDRSVFSDGGNFVGNNGTGTFDIGTVFEINGDSRVMVADNGGPTATCAPKPETVVIDNGSTINTPDHMADQRGLPRKSGSAEDIGAVERTQQAGPYVVTTGDDVVNPADGQLSLREAVMLASDHDGDDLITFTPEVSLVTLTSGTLSLTNAGTTITGPGVTVLRSPANGTPDFSVFTLTETTTLDGLTIQNGKSEYGGGIFAEPRSDFLKRLTIRNCRIVGNTATKTGGGLMLSKWERVEITNCTISDNSAGDAAGGIYVFRISTLTIDNSTISGNNAEVEAGGLYLDTPLTLSNSTISGNTTKGSGGGIFAFASLTATNATIAFNRANSDGVGDEKGGGIFSQRDTRLYNTIVGGNLRGTSFVISNLAGFDVADSSSNNLIGEDFSAGGLADGINGNLFIVNFGSVLAASLADNGGPTLTHALVADSPAIDAGNDQYATATKDQRGLNRKLGERVDIGAVEKNLAAGPYVVTETDDVVDTDYNRLSLREAVTLANDHPGADTIRFAPGVTTVTLTRGELLLTDAAATTIRGSGVTIRRSPAAGTRGFRIVNVAPAAAADLRGLTLTGGNASDGGGAYNSGTLTLSECTVSSNTAGVSGGGLYNRGLLTIDASTVSGNSANRENGGGIANLGTLRLRNSTLSGNSGHLLGGGLFNGGTATLVNVTVATNTADFLPIDTLPPLVGCGIFNYGTLTLENTLVVGNLRLGSPGGSTPDDLGGDNVVSSSHHNLIGDAASAGGLTNNSNNNIVGAALSSVLDANLADNGGPTHTHALVADSLALDRGNNTSISDVVDQRGLPRIAMGTVDIGAFENGPIVVDNAGDGNDGDYGPGRRTLREAIALANSSVIADTITFARGITTVTLTEGELGLADPAPTTILGGGVTIRRSSAANTPNFRIFNVLLAGTVATFADLTIANGNVADISQNGGGILNNGTLTLERCTLKDNVAVRGGNLANGSRSLTVRNSTLTGGNAALGGAGYNIAGTTTFVNTTITGNRGGSGGGGLYQVTDIATGGFVLKNTLVAGNFTVGTALEDIRASVGSGSSNNLIGVSTGLVGISNGTNGNKIGTAASPLDPKLGPLQNNGGLTSTFALLPGSPALDAGSNPNADGLTTDQRGADFPRLINSVVDIGAFEAEPSLVVNSTSDVVDGNYGPGQLSLREAVQLANANSGADTITFAPNLLGQTIVLTGGELPITDTLTILGPGADRLTISGNNQSRIFNIDDANNSAFKTVAISGLTLSNGNASNGTLGNGGAIFAKENLTLSAVALSGNRASNVGGAVAQDLGTLTVTASTLSGNTSGGRGGAIDVNAQVTLQISHSTISGNTSALAGGGLNTASGNVSLLNVTVTGNHSTSTSANMGGGIGNAFGPSGAVTLRNCIVAGNTRGSNVPDDLRGTAVATSNSFNNLIGDAGSAGGLSDGGSNNNIVGNSGSGTRPIASILNPTLADNGGPTRTHGLPLGSRALNAGSNSFLGGDDQRGVGYDRIQFGIIDIGAFEIQESVGSRLVVSTTDDLDDGNLNVGHLSLREAVALAHTQLNVTEITFASALAGQSIALSSELLIRKTLTIAGPGANVLTIIAHPQSRIFNIDDGNDGVDKVVRISGLDLRGGKVTGDGGAILNRENLTLSNLIVELNEASGAGGAVAHLRGSLTVTGSSFIENKAGTQGGAIDVRPGTTFRANTSTFAFNTAAAAGGGLNVATDSATLTNLTVIRNTSSATTANVGGGIAGGSSGVILLNCLVAGNTHGANVPDDLSSGAARVEQSKNNLIGNAASAGGLTNNVNGNIVGEVGLGTRPLDSILDPTLDYSGGTTLTIPLVPGSPAVNAGVDPRFLVTPTTVTSSTASGDFYPAGQLIDNSGLSTTPTLDNLASVSHASAGSGTTAWVTQSQGSDYFVAGTPPVLRFALGDTFDLTDLVVWGYNFGGPNNNEAKTFVLAFSTDGGSTYGPSIAVTQDTRSNTGATRLSLGNIYRANAVRVTVADNFFGAAGANGGDRVGLGEVKFIATNGSAGVDQRGVAYANAPDIGAFEANPIVPKSRSNVFALPSQQDAASILLRWSGQPANEFVTITGYDIYMSTDGGPYSKIRSNVSTTSDTILVDFGRTYSFYSSVRDTSGFVEPAPVVADASIVVNPFQVPGLELDGLTGILSWYGDNSQGDAITFDTVTQNGATLLKVTTTVNGRPATAMPFNLNDFAALNLYGGDGPDTITVRNLTGKSVYVEGGLGVDTVTLVNPTSSSQLVDGRGEDRFTVQGKNGSNTFELRSDGVVANGSLVFVTGCAALSVVGADSRDTLTVQGLPSYPVDFVGKLGSNTIVGPNVPTTWTITRSGVGTLAFEGGALTFSGASNLTGGSAADTFVLGVTSTAKGKVSGKIDGGGGNNTLDYSAHTAGVTVNLTTGTGTRTGGVRNIGVVLGGRGADTLTASSTGSLLVGNSGNDKLTGAVGRDILLGGGGSDKLNGKGGDDIVLADHLFAAGTPLSAANDAALFTLLAEWQRGDRDYDTRLARLREGDLDIDRPILQAFDDGLADTLTGDLERDWFFAFGADVLVDRQGNETLG